MSSAHRRPTLRIPPHFLRIACALLCIALTTGACREEDPLARAQRLQANGDLEGSLEVLREVLAEREDDAQVHYLYGRALTATGQISSAEWSLRKAMEDPEWLGPAGTQLATNALGSANYETAIEVARQVLEKEPDNLDLRLTLAHAYARSHLHPEETLAETDRILEIDPGNTEAMEPRILALLALERYDEVGPAIDELGRMIEEDEDADEWIRGWHCATSAVFAMDSEEIETARARFDDCVERFPGHSNVVQTALSFFDDQKDYTRSLEILRGALEAVPKSLDYRRRLALRVRDWGDQEEAERLLKEGVELAEGPFVPSAWQILAKHYQDLGDDEAAVEAMRQAVETSRELGTVPPQLLFDYADALVLRGDFDAARAIADEMSVEAHQALIRGRIAQEQGDHAAALAQYEEAFRLWPDNPWARYLAARSAESLGQFDRAIELYRYSIRIQPDATDARFRLATLQLAEGNATEALASLQIAGAQDSLGIEGKTLVAKLLAWSGEQQRLANALRTFSTLGPVIYGRALAAAAEGARIRFGDEGAAQMLERYGARRVDAQDPRRLDALAALVELRHAAGSLQELEPAVQTAVKAKPESGASHAVLGRYLELRGAPEAEVRAAYERAVELDPAQPLALTGLARLARESDPEAAVGYLDRAAASDPDLEQPVLQAATLLVELGRPAEAEERLDALLARHPSSARAAMEIVELRLDRGEHGVETEALAQRAVRFSGGPDALDLLARVYRERDEPARATEIEARARSIREARAARQTPPA
jgi:tetratricopeptide (TPR) repeat protein